MRIKMRCSKFDGVSIQFDLVDTPENKQTLSSFELRKEYFFEISPVDFGQCGETAKMDSTVQNVL